MHGIRTMYMLWGIRASSIWALHFTVHSPPTASSENEGERLQLSEECCSWQIFPYIIMERYLSGRFMFIDFPFWCHNIYLEFFIYQALLTLLHQARQLTLGERRYRLAAQERRLSGMVLRGHLEVAFSAYDIVVKVLADDHITYLAPHRFSTRMLEVQQDRPSKSIVIDATQHLQVKDATSQKPQVDLPDTLSLTQAMTRRSLALDLVGAATFSRAEAWNRVLVQHLQRPPPPGFKFMDTAQLLRADRAGWLHMADHSAAQQ